MFVAATKNLGISSHPYIHRHIDWLCIRIAETTAGNSRRQANAWEAAFIFMADNFNEVWSRVVASGGGGGMDALLGSGGLFPRFFKLSKRRLRCLVLRPRGVARARSRPEKILENFIEDESSDSAYYAALAARNGEPNAEDGPPTGFPRGKKAREAAPDGFIPARRKQPRPEKARPDAAPLHLRGPEARYAANRGGRRLRRRRGTNCRARPAGNQRELFLALADDERRHAREIKRLVEEGLG
jgi:hypothetical protein